MSSEQTDNVGAETSPRRGPAFLIGLGLLHGLILALALPPVGVWWLALVSLVPVCVAGERLRTGRALRGALWFALGTLPAWAYLHLWILNVSALGFVPLAVILALEQGAGVWAIGSLRRAGLGMWFAGPVGWTATEFLRGEVIADGYPWGLAVHPLIEWPWLVGAASVGGQYLVLLLLAGWCAGLTMLARRETHRRGVIVALGWMLAWVGAAWVGREGESPTRVARVAVVQTNVPQDNKTYSTIEREVKDWQRFEAMTVEAARQLKREESEAERQSGERTGGTPVPPGPKTTTKTEEGSGGGGGVAAPAFIVWPETMLPGPSLSPSALTSLHEQAIYFNLDADPADPSRPTKLAATAFADRLLDVQAELGVPMVVGALGHEGFRVGTEDGKIRLDWDKRFNSVFVVEGGKIGRERYDKMRLTPFGEVMPYISRWKWLERQLLALGARGMSFDLAAGEKPVVLHVGGEGDAGVRLVTPICFEVTTAWVCRGLVFEGGRRRADVIVNLTNDGWFSWWDGGRAQHLQIARWRCVELRTAMVRAANTGISAIVDAGGRVVQVGVEAGRTDVDGVLAGEVAMGGPVPVYAHVGDLAGWIACGGLGVGLMWGRWKRRTGARAGERA